jgi:hypothetical protein
MFKFGFDPLEFHEVMAHGLRKINYELSVLCTFVAPPPIGFAVSDSYKSKFSLVMLELF